MKNTSGILTPINIPITVTVLIMFVGTATLQVIVMLHGRMVTSDFSLFFRAEAAAVKITNLVQY